jgi:acetyl-CoA C-acetyltransferase
MDNVWILGGYQSDFARSLTREGHDFAGDRRSAVQLPINPSRGSTATTVSFVVSRV